MKGITVSETVTLNFPAGKQVLSEKKLAFLLEDENGKYAVLKSMGSEEAILKADEGVSIAIPVAALTHPDGITAGAKIYFNEDGSIKTAVFVKVEKTTKAANTVPKRSGSAVHHQDTGARSKY